MNWILMLAVIYCSSSVTFAYLPEEEFGQPLEDESKKWHAMCDAIVGGISQEDIDNLRHGKFGEVTLKLKDYLVCVVIVAGGVTPDIEFNTEEFERVAPKQVPNLVQNYKECFQKGKETKKILREIVFSMVTCAYEKMPKDIVFF